MNFIVEPCKRSIRLFLCVENLKGLIHFTELKKNKQKITLIIDFIHGILSSTFQRIYYLFPSFNVNSIQNENDVIVVATNRLLWNAFVGHIRRYHRQFAFTSIFVH